MSALFFSPRKPFDFSKDTLDIGNPLSWRKDNYIKFVLNKIFDVGTDRFKEFYVYHLAYYIATQSQADERLYFMFLWELIAEEAERLKGLSIYGPDHLKNLHKKNSLKNALAYLRSINVWGDQESAEMTIARQQIQITELERKIMTITAELKAFRQQETDDYINIAAGQRDTLLDLFLQLQELLLPNGKELVFAQTQAAWTKMICKGFREADQEIKYHTIRRYFPADKNDPGISRATIKSKFKLFQIKKAPRWS